MIATAMFLPVLSLALSASSNPVQPASDQAFFAILAETKVGRMAGMPPMDFGQLPAGIKLPPEAMMFSGQPVRLLNIRLWSPSIAPADAAASVVPPAGLKQGEKLILDLFRPKEGETGSSDRIKDFDPDKEPEKFTIKIYWGSSKTVKEGQPKIITWGGLTPEQKEAMKEGARQAQVGAQSSYFYKAGWTTGYWPTKKQPGAIAKESSLVGRYTLTTNYTGSVEIEAPNSVNFLDAITLSSPNLENPVDLKKSIDLKWSPIANALGLHASIIAMQGKNTMIVWSSSEVASEASMGDPGFMQMADVRAAVEKTHFMAGSRTSVDVPAGIFKDADFVMMNMGGWGPGAALEKAQPLPRIQTKTSLMVMLGGKEMDF